MKLAIFLLAASITAAAAATGPNPKQTFCRDNRCLTCIGRYCTTTCQGESCKDCPLGDCCDGVKCNICRGERCCSSPECNSCIVGCLKKCQGRATCHFDCFQECLPGGGNGTTDGQHKFRGSSLISNKNYLPVNVTTFINITNTIRNENVIHNPIYINTTNVNNHTGHNTKHRKQVIINHQVNNYPGEVHVDNYPGQVNNTGEITVAPTAQPEPENRFNCCQVVHPERCQDVPGQEERLCYTGRHEECSELCVGRHVHIVEEAAEKSRCITLKQQPHWFCGQYVVENCDGCYQAEEEEQECPDKCKASLIANDFYNKLYRKEE